MKTTGATWKAYLASWPKGQYFDDSNETFDGKEPIDEDPSDEAVVEVTCGVVFANENDNEGFDLIRHFRRWEKSLTHATVLCTVPKLRMEEFAAVLKSFGWKALV